jgi:hypothetical protein
LANRDIEIDFQKEAVYYTLKKGEKKWSVYSWNKPTILFFTIECSSDSP